MADNIPELERARLMLEVASKYILENCPDDTIWYDDASCDGYCVSEDCKAAAEMLTATRAAPKVKPLVWERSKSIQTDFKSKCILGTYLVECFNDGGEDYYIWTLGWGKIEGGKKSSAEESKVDAQADYESRILSALQ